MEKLRIICYFGLMLFLTNCTSYNQLPKDYQAGNFGESEEDERKIIYNAYVTLAVEQTDSTGSDIKKIAQKYEGYVQEEGTYKAVIRVKANLLEKAIIDVASLGKIKEKRLSGTDVTEDYLDNEIRLDNALKARERYLALLEQAENVEAALKVEKELERLNEVIELIKGKMNRIDHLSQYATINITLQERKKPGVLGYIGLGFYHAVKWLFVRN